MKDKEFIDWILKKSAIREIVIRNKYVFNSNGIRVTNKRNKEIPCCCNNCKKREIGVRFDDNDYVKNIYCYAIKYVDDDEVTEFFYIDLKDSEVKETTTCPYILEWFLYGFDFADKIGVIKKLFDIGFSFKREDNLMGNIYMEE